MKKKINGFIGKLEMDSSDRGRKKEKKTGVLLDWGENGNGRLC